MRLLNKKTRDGEGASEMVPLQHHLASNRRADLSILHRDVRMAQPSRARLPNHPLGAIPRRFTAFVVK
jgi:hypothetical protein